MRRPSLEKSAGLQLAAMRISRKEDFDFWCCLAEKGMWGCQSPEILVDYRVHGASMQDLITNLPDNKLPLLSLMKRRHPWLSLVQSFNGIQHSNDVERRSEESQTT